MKTAVRIPKQIWWGQDTLTELEHILPDERTGSVLIVTDKGIVKAGLVDKVTQILEKAKRHYEIEDNIPAEPSVQALDSILRGLRGRHLNAVIGLGGGSAMDAAKLFSALLKGEHNVEEALNDHTVIKDRFPLIMIPTTCGTGSEATGNAIVAVPEENIKVGIVNDVLISDCVILDSEMVRNLPGKIVASTGIDALAHTVECFTSKKANAFSDLYAAEGTRLLFANLEKAYENPEDLNAKSALQLGACYGGIAIAASGTTAVHALSYPLGGRYHIPHGIANAVLLAPVMRANLDACEIQLSELCIRCWPESSTWTERRRAEWLIEKIEHTVKALNIPRTLTELGVMMQDADALAEAGSKVTRLLDNNRRAFTVAEIRELYLSVLE